MFTTGVFTATWERLVRGWSEAIPEALPAQEVPRAYALALEDMAIHAELVGTGRCPCRFCRGTSVETRVTTVQASALHRFVHADDTHETSFEQAAKDAGESEDLRLRLLATEVDVLGASPLEAARVLFGGPRV